MLVTWRSPGSFSRRLPDLMPEQMQRRKSIGKLSDVLTSQDFYFRARIAFRKHNRRAMKMDEQSGWVARAVWSTKALAVMLAMSAMVLTIAGRGVPSSDFASGETVPVVSANLADDTAVDGGSSEEAGDSAATVNYSEAGIQLVGFDPWRGLKYSWWKTKNFVGCIVGVGVPIGVAWSFATNPYLWRYVLGMGPIPASYGGAVYNYATWVKARCRTALL